MSLANTMGRSSKLRTGRSNNTQAGMRTMREENDNLKQRIKELTNVLEQQLYNPDEEVQKINKTSSPVNSRGGGLYHDRSQSVISIAESNRFDALHSIIKEKNREVS